MAIEIEPTVLAEIKEHAKAWLDCETKIHEQALKEKCWDFINDPERTIIREVCLGSIAHRIMETLYPEEYRKLTDLILNTLSAERAAKEKAAN